MLIVDFRKIYVTKNQLLIFHECPIAGIAVNTYLFVT